jgi:hypothetical protein
MSDDEKRIITPGQFRGQFTKGGKYNVSRDEAVSIAVQIGQQVYDQVADEHKKAMELLQRDMHRHFAEIRNVTAANIMDLQRRSFGFAVAYDLRRIQTTLEEWYWRFRYAVGLVPDDGVVGGIEPEEPQQLEGEPENVGAPTEQPSLEKSDEFQKRAEVDREEVGRPGAERRGDPGLIVEERFAGRQASQPEPAQG